MVKGPDRLRSSSSRRDALADVPIITKPYHRISMLKALDKLIVPDVASAESGRRSM
jgi:hypothetical protein